MAFALRATPHFQRAIVRFRRQHPELDRRLDQTLRDLSEDPHQPHLRLHALHGDLEGSHAVRVTYAYRITLTLRLSEEHIELVDIGSHDDVYR